MCTCLSLQIPNSDKYIIPGNRVKLGRFDSTIWLVGHGWFTWGGNRPFCGWHLINVEQPNIVKPLQLTDLDDIYLIEM